MDPSNNRHYGCNKMPQLSTELFVANTINRFLEIDLIFQTALLLIAVSFLGNGSAFGWGNCQPNGVKIIHSISFSRLDNLNLRCDVFLPRRDVSKSQLLPAVILVHGGAWSIGSRSQLGGLAMQLAKNGLLAVTIDYRLAPTWRHPSQIDDIRSALAWISTRQECYGVDTSRLGLFGYSAGGHLVCLIGTLADETLTTQSLVSDWPIDDVRWLNVIHPKAVCVGGAPCDLVSLATKTGPLSFFLDEPNDNSMAIHQFASPNNFTSKGDASTLIIHGLSDWIVPPDLSLSFYRRRVVAGTESVFVGLPNRGHIGTFFDIRTTNNMVDYFKSKLVR